MRFLHSPAWVNEIIPPPHALKAHKKLNQRKQNMSQSLSQLWVHIIFSTKNRHPFLKDALVRERLYDYIKAICHTKNCNAKIVNGIEDHLHILVSLHKNISLSKLVEEIKRSSSKWIKTLDHSLCQFYWQNGYGAFSVSQSNVERVKWYIKNQREHHQKQSFQDELRKFLVHYNIEYDERYLWD